MTTTLSTYRVVHTLGSEDAYNEVARFTERPDVVVQYAYSDALDCAAEVRAHDGHWARVLRNDEAL